MKIFNLALVLISFLFFGCNLEPLPLDPFDKELKFDEFDKVELFNAFELKNTDIVVGGRAKVKSTQKYDAILVRFDKNGLQKDYATFDSGGGLDDEIVSLTIDNTENIYLAGRQKDNSNVYKGLIFKIQTDGKFQSVWVKTYEEIKSRVTYSQILYTAEQLVVIKGIIDGKDAINDNSGYFKLSTNGDNKTCMYAYNESFYPYNSQDAVVNGNKIVFVGCAGATGKANGGSNVFTFDINTSCTTPLRKTDFGKLSDGDFDCAGCVAIGSDGNIIAIVNSNVAAPKNNLFKPYFVKMNSSNLSIVNNATYKQGLPTDLSNDKSGTSSIVGTNDGNYFYATNFSDNLGGNIYSKINKGKIDDSSIPIEIKKLDGWNTRKIITVSNGNFILLSARAEQINRVIRINSFGKTL
jgi:hypothetical protein